MQTGISLYGEASIKRSVPGQSPLLPRRIVAVVEAVIPVQAEIPLYGETSIKRSVPGQSPLLPRRIVAVIEAVIPVQTGIQRFACHWLLTVLEQNHLAAHFSSRTASGFTGC